jgi:hypothetical protein
MKILAAFLLGITLVGPVRAQDYSDWSALQKMPSASENCGYVAGTSCCDKSDDRVTSVWHGSKGIQAWVAELGEWVDVPRNKIIYEADNPMNGAVLWYLPKCGVLCFADRAGG